MSGDRDVDRTREAQVETTQPDTGASPRSGLPPAEPGRYQLGDEVARGGGGRIVLARDRRLDRTVAIKEPLAAGGWMRLLREARVLARLEHPGIVPIHDAARWSTGVPFFAMKHLDGRSLRAELDEVGTGPARLRLVPALLAIADAMAHAHARGIVHRDLKPENVMVGRHGEITVIDWGLARDTTEAPEPDGGSDFAAPTHLTVDGAVVGTPRYMSPEQARGEEADVRSDVYSLGVMLYELLAGRVAYEGRSARDVVDQVKRGGPPALDPSALRVPPELVAIADRALRRDPAQRYATAGELADELRRYQSGRLVRAFRYPARARARRWLWSHRVALTVTALSAVAAAAVVTAVRGRTAPAADPCAGAAAEASALWTPGRAAALRDRLGGLAGAGAPAAAHALIARLDGTSRRLVDAKLATCREHFVRRDLAAPAFELRNRCLARQLAQVAAVIDKVERDPPAVARLGKVAATLPDPGDCDDAASLAAEDPTIADPEQRDRAAALRTRIDEAILREAAGDSPGAVALDRANVDAARALGIDVVLAEALTQAGRDVSATRDPESGIAMLREALELADRAGADRTRARAAVFLVAALSVAGRPAEALAFAGAAQAVVDRVGNPRHQTTLLSTLGGVAADAGDLTRSIELRRRAVASADRLPPDERAPRVKTRMDLGMSLAARGEFAESYELLTTARAEARGMYGGDHPGIAQMTLGLANVEFSLERVDDALRSYGEAAGMYERLGMGGHPEMAMLLKNQASVLMGIGREADAAPLLARAGEILAASVGKDTTDYAALLLRRGELAMAMHSPDAMALLDEAAATLARAGVTTGTRLFIVHHRRFELQLAAGDLTAAHRTLDLEGAATQAGSGALDDLLQRHLDTGALALREHRAAAALASFDAALAVELEHAHTLRGLAHAGRARALDVLGGREAEVTAAIAAARADLTAAGVTGTAELARLDAWAASR